MKREEVSRLDALRMWDMGHTPKGEAHCNPPKLKKWWLGPAECFTDCHLNWGESSILYVMEPVLTWTVAKERHLEVTNYSVTIRENRLFS